MFNDRSLWSFFYHWLKLSPDRLKYAKDIAHLMKFSDDLFLETLSKKVVNPANFHLDLTSTVYYWRYLPKGMKIEEKLEVEKDFYDLMHEKVIMCEEKALSERFGDTSRSQLYPKLKDTFMEADYLTHHDMYLIDWHNYCVELHTNLEKNDLYETRYDTKLQGFDYNGDDLEGVKVTSNGEE